MQKARGYHHWLPLLVSIRFQGLFQCLVQAAFHLSLTVLFSIGRTFVFSLTGWCRQIHTRLLLPRATQDTHQNIITFIQGYHLLWLTFPGNSV